MARPAKSVAMKSGAIADAEAKARQAMEDKLKGTGGVPDPPETLTESQQEIFRFITEQLKASEVLGQADVYVLEFTSVAIDKIHTINAMVDENPRLLSSTSLQNTRTKYQSDFWRGCNELCLSPQARAKLGGLVAQAVKKEKDPLLAALGEDD